MRKLKILEGTSTINKKAVFEKYTEHDINIAREAYGYNLYLIGGTAIDLWCNYFGISSWRSRSNNDLDFWSYADNYDEVNEFSQKMQNDSLAFKIVTDSSYMKMLRSDKISTDLDILIDFDINNRKFCKEINKIGVMSPVYLFASKFDRYLNSNNQVRKETDFKDLQVLLKIIEKMNDFDALEVHLSNQMYDQRAEDELNKIIQSVM